MSGHKSRAPKAFRLQVYDERNPGGARSIGLEGTRISRQLRRAFTHRWGRLGAKDLDQGYLSSLTHAPSESHPVREGATSWDGPKILSGGIARDDRLAYLFKLRISG